MEHTILKDLLSLHMYLTQQQSNYVIYIESTAGRNQGTYPN